MQILRNFKRLKCLHSPFKVYCGFNIQFFRTLKNIFYAARSFEIFNTIPLIEYTNLDQSILFFLRKHKSFCYLHLPFKVFCGFDIH